MSQAPEHAFGLFGCLTDFPVCLYTCFLPGCAMVSNNAMLRSEKCSFMHLICFSNPYWARQTIRTRKHMARADVPDCFTAMCCMPCMVCQDQRELKLGNVGLPPNEYYFNEQKINTAPKAPVFSPQPYNPNAGYVKQGY